MELITVTAVEAMPVTRLLVRLSNGRAIEVDVSEYFSEPGYESLREPKHFALAHADEWGHSVHWPGDIGIPIDALLRMADEQVRQA